MKRQWTQEELPEYWTLSAKELDLIGDSKTELVSRINYELCVLHTLREKVRSKEVWVQHANRFRNYVEYVIC